MNSPPDLMIDLRRFCMPSACFCTDSSSTFAQICWILRLSAGIDRGLLLSSFSFMLSPHLFNRIQVWRVGRPLSMRAGFDVIWDVLFEPFICHPCFVCGDAPSCTNVQLRLPEPNILSKSGVLLSSEAQGTWAPSGRPCRLIS